MWGCGLGSDEEEELVRFDPENFGVSITAPDDAGNVTVVGHRAVRPGVVVTARVTRPKNFPSLSESLPFLTRGGGEISGVRNLARPHETAFLNVCGSELPTCPQITANNYCQVEADSTGSFALQIPGLVGELVNLNYVNPISCRYTEVFSGGFIENDSIGMDMMAYDMAYDAANDRIYVVGDDRLGGETLRIFAASSHAQTAAIGFPDIDVPRHVNVFSTEASDGRMMFVGGEDLSKLGALPELDSIDSTLFYNLDDASGNALRDLVFGSANDFASDTDPSCSDLTDENYTRALFHDATSLYFHEFAGSIDQSAGVVESRDAIYLNTLDFSIKDSSGISYEVLDIPFAQIITDDLSLEDSLYLVALVALSAEESTFLFLKVDTNDINFCGHTDFSANSAFDLGSDEEGVQITVFNGKGVYANSAVFMGFLKKATQEIVLLDTQTYANFVDYGVTYANQRASDGVLTYQLDITQPVSAIAGFGRLGDEVEELLVFGKNVGGSDFLVYNNVESTLKQEKPQFAFTPRNNFYFHSEAPFLVLDGGISNERSPINHSLIRFYDLTPE